MPRPVDETVAGLTGSGRVARRRRREREHDVGRSAHRRSKQTMRDDFVLESGAAGRRIAARPHRSIPARHPTRQHRTVRDGVRAARPIARRRTRVSPPGSSSTSRSTDSLDAHLVRRGHLARGGAERRPLDRVRSGAGRGVGRPRTAGARAAGADTGRTPATDRASAGVGEHVDRRRRAGHRGRRRAVDGDVVGDPRRGRRRGDPPPAPRRRSGSSSASRCAGDDGGDGIPDPAARIQGAWASATDALVDAGLSIPPSFTDDEIARRGDPIAPTAHRELHRLAVLNSAATYGAPNRPDLLAQDAQQCLDAIDAAIAEPKSRWQRARWRLSLRSLRSSTRSPVTV